MSVIVRGISEDQKSLGLLMVNATNSLDRGVATLARLSSSGHGSCAARVCETPATIHSRKNAVSVLEVNMLGMRDICETQSMVRIKVHQPTFTQSYLGL